MFDQPVLVGLNDTDRAAVAADVSRWEADKVAVVIAESPEIATVAAAALIDIEWELLPVVPDIEAALRNETLVHPEAGDTNDYYGLASFSKGDHGRQAGPRPTVVIEGTYHVPHQEHAYLQVEAATAFIDDDGRITVETGGQWTWEDQQQIAHALDMLR